MSYQLLAPDAKPCVWMCAGVLRYRLCDLDYECDCCPLDAALRRAGMADGWRPTRNGTSPVVPPPSDRRYAPGHAWVRALLHPRHGRCSLGIDAFGAAILGPARAVHCRLPCGRTMEVGDLLCDLDVGAGMLSVGAPVPGRLERFNPDLRSHPELVAEDPYRRGWIAELSHVESSALESLEDANAAGARATRDLRRLRRDVAVRLFQELVADAPVWNEGDRRQTDLRFVLGDAYLELAAGLVH